MADSSAAREYENRSLLVRRSEPAQVNLTPIQSSGQAASALTS